MTTNSRFSVRNVVALCVCVCVCVVCVCPSSTTEVWRPAGELATKWLPDLNCYEYYV